MEYFKIELNGNHFIESYLVYVIEVESPNYSRYFYIGQTGDRNHITARPAFRRLGGHLSDQGHSTENQLYRGIATKILKHEIIRNQPFGAIMKREVSSFLQQSKLSMHVFPIRDFDRLSADAHVQNRKFVESIENEVISYLSKRVGVDSVLNKKHPQNKIPLTEEESEIVQKIVATVFPEQSIS